MPTQFELQDDGGWPKSFRCTSCREVVTITEKEAADKIHNLPVTRAAVTAMRRYGWVEEGNQLLCEECQSESESHESDSPEDTEQED
jgi:hypothetical protein